ncbi:MoxR family ATPase [Actinosynnema sp. NPDC050436]|uniref:AAA family ATPase n=1 Tax=Actinosynnema sp. NPDC050436 TaxID=3155659 RepID=UPI0033FE782D
MSAADAIAEVGENYICPSDLRLAVKVARATGRPLLLFGDPGCGKSSLPRYVAAREGLRYYEHVVTARTSAQDLLWSFDSVRRLGDAQAKDVKDDRHYVTPGALWWAFDRDGARELVNAREPRAEWNRARSGAGAVVLVDEIDKADPDVPNSLLVPLDERVFSVTDVRPGHEVREPAGRRALVVITSNEERDLPPAFVRRCVVHRVLAHDDSTLEKIAGKHIGTTEGYPLDKLIAALNEARRAAGEDRRRKPSTAEFLDAVRACLGHGIAHEHHADLAAVLGMIFEKNVRDPGRPGG